MSLETLLQQRQVALPPVGRCGLVYEERTLGNIKLFSLTTFGEALLLLMRELEAEDGLRISSKARFAS